MIKKNIFKKIPIIVVIIFLFFTFFLVGFSGSKIEIPLNKTLNGDILRADGEDNGNGEEGASGRGLNIEDLINLIQEVTTKHLDVLWRVYEKVPEVAKGAILKAIDVSIRGSNRAIEAISKGKPSTVDNGNNGLKTFCINLFSNNPLLVNNDNKFSGFILNTSCQGLLIR